MSTLEYAGVRATTEALAAPLSPEDQTVQSMADVSPTKWHRAHTTWFFETFLLAAHVSGYQDFHPRYRYLFNSYYEAVGPRHARPERGLITRPGIEEIAEYRAHVDRFMPAVLEDEKLRPLVQLGLHHEQQHQELIVMDIKHVLSCNPLSPVYGSLPWATDAGCGSRGWMAFDGGIVEAGVAGVAGVAGSSPGFAFDNEGPRHEVLLRPFEIASSLVSCADWQAFIDDGGYARPELWMSDGYATAQALRWDAPMYWERVDDRWHVFGLDGQRPVDGAAPVVHVSWYEADAYARWTGGRLPLEAEWETMAPGVDTPGWFGSVWQWTASPYVAYPGFRPAAGAVGEYNGKFMVNQHVLRGSCVATPPGHARRTYRNFFPPSARWAFSGLRVARDG